MDPLTVAVDHHDLMAIIQHSGTNAIITLDLGSESHVTMPKVIERHPFRNLIRHVDFLKISLDEVTTADVVIELVGEAPGTDEGGVVAQSASTLSVSALPMAIPSSIEVDVSGLALGDGLRVEDLPALDGIEFLDDPDMLIVAVTVPRAEVEEPEEGDEAAEGEDGDAEGGDDAVASDEASGDDASGE
jgi:large subunit ribosomal protein L25